MPGSKKIELFARNNNLRVGWFSLGNQLGEIYDKWISHIECNECSDKIYTGIKRYKSKTTPNYDVCGKCFDEKGKNCIEFFEIQN